MEWLMRDIHLRVLATIASSDETMAYIFHRSEDPKLREMADQMINSSNQIKRLFRETLTGKELELFLLLAEGDYIPPKEK